MTHPHRIIAWDMGRCAYAVLFAAAMGATAGDSQAQSSPAVPAATQAPLTPPRNAQSRRYEVHQTFDGQVFDKDDSVWIVTSEFAQVFGMPQSYVGPITGAVAAAFRIEKASYKACGLGGRAENCMEVEQCLIDLYFDESKTQLPWATDQSSYTKPWQSSIRWLRQGERNPAFSAPPPPGVKLNRVVGRSGVVAFADPDSKWQAIFTSNMWIGNNRQADDEISGSMALFGYQRQFFGNYSMLTLQQGCSAVNRKSFIIRLDAREAIYSPPSASFVRTLLPEQFIVAMNNSLQTLVKRHADYFRDLQSPAQTNR